MIAPTVETRRLLRWGAALLLVLGAVALELRWYLVRQLPFVMDELVDTQLAVQVSRGVRMYVDQPYERMPLMTYLLAALHDSERGSFEAAIAGRRFFFFVSLAAVALVWCAARPLLGARAAMLAPALLLAFSNFLERSLRIRADSLSSTFALAALLVLLLPRPRAWQLASAGVALGLAFVTTQKAVYFVVAFAVALAWRTAAEGARPAQLARRLLRDGGLAAAGFFLPLAALAAAMARLGALEPFLRQTLLYGAEVGLVATTYRDTWIHLAETMERNPGIWFLGLAGALVLAYEGRGPSADVRRRPALAAAGAWTLTLLALLLQHTAKFPYVFLNIAPGLAICGSVLLARLGRGAFAGSSPLDWRQIAWLAGTAATLVAFPVYHHVRAFRSDLIWGQRLVMERVDAVTEPTDAVFDGIGIATTRAQATPWSLTGRWVQERRAGREYPVLDWLRRTQPRVLIRNYRLDALMPAERRFLDRHFVQDWANVFVVGAALEAFGGADPPREIDLLAAAEYALIAADLRRVSIDGRPARPFERLAAGGHTLSVAGEPQRVVLLLASAARLPTPPRRDPFPLFPSYSD